MDRDSTLCKGKIDLMSYPQGLPAGHKAKRPTNREILGASAVNPRLSVMRLGD